MTNIQSKIVRVSTSCKDYVHPWTDSCWSSTAGLLLQASQHSLRIYTAVYMLSLMTRRRLPTRYDIRRTIHGILQSSAFLATNSFCFVMFTCLLRNFVGCYYFLTVSYIPAFLASLCAIFIERPARRLLLTLYVANVATETIWRMATSRKLVKSIPHGQVAIFGTSLSILMYIFRLGLHNKYPDSFFNILRFVVGNEEGKVTGTTNLNNINYNLNDQEVENQTVDHASSMCAVSHPPRYFHFLLETYRNQYNHKACPHNYSCLHYCISGSLKLFLMGVILQFGLKAVVHFNRIVNSQYNLSELIMGSFGLGIFLGGFTFLFKIVSCIQRRVLGFDHPCFAIPASLVGSCAFVKYPDNTVALYVMWKTLQICYNLFVQNGNLPSINGFQILLYCASTALLFHVAIWEPMNLRPSYWKFLYAISGGRVANMDRSSIDVWGLNSSKNLNQILQSTKTCIGDVKFSFS